MITGNTAANDGGLSVVSTSATINHGTISGNTASTEGQNVYLQSGTLNYDGSAHTTSIDSDIIVA